jgi:hypothetical protein
MVGVFQPSQTYMLDGQHGQKVFVWFFFLGAVELDRHPLRHEDFFVSARILNSHR